MTRRDPNSWTVVCLPERDLAEVVLELAAPLLERLGPAPAIEDARATLALAVSQRMRGRAASRDDAATFDLLTERWREHWLDPRLVDSWSYEIGAAGVPRLVCIMGLPEGVRALIPPPAETSA